MTFDFNIHPEGYEFQAEVHAHAVGAPFSTLSIVVGDMTVKFYGKADDALKLIRAARLLNEVFAPEREREADEDSSQFGVGA